MVGKRNFALWFSAVLCATCLTAGDIQYTYDDLGRLKTAHNLRTDVILEYSYDPAGNRTQHVVSIPQDGSSGDSIPTLGTGPNLLSTGSWPVGSAPSSTPTISGWNNPATFANESRWARVMGPGASGQITALDAGQTESDSNGGGFARTNHVTIDETKGYEFSIYFRKYDLNYQSLYLGTNTNSSGPGEVKRIYNNTAYTNPYFISWNTTSQNSNNLDPDKWYKVVGYVMPEGYPQESTANWGGVYDVVTGAKIANIANYRWNEDRTTDSMYMRFFTYYSASSQNRFTSYFYQPEVRVTNISYTPVVPSLSISHSNATEGSNITYTVTLSAATTVDIKVNYAVSDGGGTNSASGIDYTSTSGTLTIPAGSTSANVTVATIDDAIHEENETVKLTLSSPMRATISESSELATINDNDAGPQFSVNDVSVSEGGNLTFTVTKTGSTAKSHNANYATDNGSAGSSDYTAKAGILTFAAGEASKTVSVVTTQDSTYESNETLYINLSNATSGATITDAQGVGTITNDDSGPQFSVNNVSVSEAGIPIIEDGILLGYEDSKLTFTITKTGSTTLSHSVSYATSNGSAGSADYTSKSGTLTFTASQTSKTVKVNVTDDVLHENSETVNLNLSNATAAATISDSLGVGTIANDDAGPAFSVNNVSVSEGGNLTFTIAKSGSTAKSHNVSYATANGSAGSADYTAKSGTLTFTAGQNSKMVSVVTTQDSTHESNETLYLNLSSATAGATISDSQGTGTINDDDVAVVLVRNSGGAIQSPFTQYINNDLAPFIPELYMTEGPSGVVHVSDSSFCDTGTAPESGYSFTGNGCELRQD